MERIVRGHRRIERARARRRCSPCRLRRVSSRGSRFQSPGVADSGVTALPCQTHFRCSVMTLVKALSKDTRSIRPLGEQKTAAAVSVYFHSDTAVELGSGFGVAGMADWS